MRIVECAADEVGLVESLSSIAGPDRRSRLQHAADVLREQIGDGTLWHVNSTAGGGGVAEMLHVLLPLYRELGVDARWMVVEGDEDFFSVTKDLGVALYGGGGVALSFGEREKRHYLGALRANAAQMRDVVRPADVLFLHDHQTAGLLPFLADKVRASFWRCHVGVDVPNDASRAGWRFLEPFLGAVTATVFSVDWHVPEFLRRGHVETLPPFISPVALKHVALPASVVDTCLQRCGLQRPPGGVEPPTREVVVAGRQVRLASDVDIVKDRPPRPDEPLLVQVSRWDRLKDMHGVLRSFAGAVDAGYLALVGPDPSAIADDLEQELWYRKCLDEWSALPAHQRERVSLVCLPMVDLDENALLVNAIQSTADVILQKSLAEGFGLTVTEAMWKAKPVVASVVGGIRDQITHGVDGLLVDDPEDLVQFGQLINAAVDGTVDTVEMGRRAHRKAARDYLPDREVVTTARLLAGE